MKTEKPFQVTSCREGAAVGDIPWKQHHASHPSYMIVPAQFDNYPPHSACTWHAASWQLLWMLWHHTAQMLALAGQLSGSSSILEWGLLPRSPDYDFVLCLWGPQCNWKSDTKARTHWVLFKKKNVVLTFPWYRIFSLPAAGFVAALPWMPLDFLLSVPLLLAQAHLPPGTWFTHHTDPSSQLASLPLSTFAPVSPVLDTLTLLSL